MVDPDAMSRDLAVRPTTAVERRSLVQILYPPRDRSFLVASLGHSKTWLRTRFGALSIVMSVLTLFLVTAKPLGIIALETIPKWISVPTLFGMILVILGKGAALAHREAVDKMAMQVETKTQELADASLQRSQHVRMRDQLRLASIQVEQLEREKAALVEKQAAATTEEERELMLEEAGAFLYHGNELLVRFQQISPGLYIFQDNEVALAPLRREADEWAAEFEKFLTTISKARLVPVFRSDAAMPPHESGGVIGPRTRWWIRWLKQRISQMEKVIEQL